MARELQNRVLDLIERALGQNLPREVRPVWLLRFRRHERGQRRRWRMGKLVWRPVTPQSNAYLQQDAADLDLSVGDLILLILAEAQWRERR